MWIRGGEREGALQRRKHDRREQTADLLILKGRKKHRDGERTGDSDARGRGSVADETEGAKEEDQG